MCIPGCDKKIPHTYDRIYKMLMCIFKHKFVKKFLFELGYHDEPESLSTFGIHTKQTYNGLLMNSIGYLISEIVYATLSVLALLRLITTNDIKLDIQLIFWGAVGILRYLIIIFKSQFDYHKSIKTIESGTGNFTTIGNAVYRKRYKPYLVCLLLCGIYYNFHWILLSGITPSNTQNLWVLPLCLCFCLYFALTAFLITFDIVCCFCGYRSATFNLDLKNQLKEAFK